MREFKEKGNTELVGNGLQSTVYGLQEEYFLKTKIPAETHVSTGIATASMAKCNFSSSELRIVILSKGVTTTEKFLSRFRLTF